jgi:hypothetical protein
MYGMFSLWYKEVEKLKKGEITREEYDHWRYTYPQVNAERLRAYSDEKLAERRFNKGRDKK